MRNAAGRPATSGSPRQEIRALAVLPFAFLNPVAGDETLGIGLADALITRLGQLRRTRGAADFIDRAFRRRDLAPAQAGRELGGGRRDRGKHPARRDTRCASSVQLVSVAERRRDLGREVRCRSRGRAGSSRIPSPSASPPRSRWRWRAASGRPPRAALTAQIPMPTSTTSAAATSSRKRTRDALLRSGGVHGARHRHRSAVRAGARRASDAWIQLGLRAAVSQSLRPREVMPKARAAAEKALALDDSLSEAHATLGQVLFTYEWKRDAGIAELLRAIELNPNNQNAQHWYAMALAGLGRFDEALAQIQRALAIDPAGASSSTPTSASCCIAPVASTRPSPSCGTRWRWNRDS